MRLLDKAPGRRFGSAGELIHAIEEAEAGLRCQAPAWYRVAILAAAALVLVFAACVVLFACSQFAPGGGAPPAREVPGPRETPPARQLDELARGLKELNPGFEGKFLRATVVRVGDREEVRSLAV